MFKRIKDWFAKRLPTEKEIEKNRNLRWMSKWLKERPYLWQFTKHCVAGGVAVSFLVSFIPLPIQMVMAATFAIIFRVNLPIAVLATWLTNPITFVPSNLLIYWVGRFFIGANDNEAQVSLPTVQFHWDNLRLTWQETLVLLQSIGKAYLIGLPIVAMGGAIISYVLIYSIWTVYEKIFNVKPKKLK